jgi:hypothetical protein
MMEDDVAEGDNLGGEDNIAQGDDVAFEPALAHNNHQDNKGDRPPNVACLCVAKADLWQMSQHLHHLQALEPIMPVIQT